MRALSTPLVFSLFFGLSACGGGDAESEGDKPPPPPTCETEINSCEESSAEARWSHSKPCGDPTTLIKPYATKFGDLINLNESCKNNLSLSAANREASDMFLKIDGDSFECGGKIKLRAEVGFSYKCLAGTTYQAIALCAMTAFAQATTLKQAGIELPARCAMRKKACVCKIEVPQDVSVTGKVATDGNKLTFSYKLPGGTDVTAEGTYCARSGTMLLEQSLPGGVTYRDLWTL